MANHQTMKEYEITFTYLNGCSGAAHPLTQFDETELADPADYVRRKHGRDFDRFVREVREDGQIVYTFDNGTITYIYEFNEL